ncbi:MAG: hypothetical protein A2848_02890 [Candidatus Magasanikbacteria bacterium RIFCSPHIGHO2_01_FULL_50_8]|uniref:Uncharacterized protein n=2 Tax=Candidatus Magasanikiibacteriota TaxID=1752731 RepID=A0A1F6LVT9_9BACT|nr:MAG: hypothetical protein A2848_02890 [Candidatus Magasanikbacteria bacterium RIFCSPHIGHO2_01_FULL_50_8]OGH67786.1 MAG: hypothetical protein A3C15_02930 [Candidatus Magasanikbacteria bacterium RIFCSPHIGHO2_02_FULL_50_9b]
MAPASYRCGGLVNDNIQAKNNEAKVATPLKYAAPLPQTRPAPTRDNWREVARRIEAQIPMNKRLICNGKDRHGNDVPITAETFIDTLCRARGFVQISRIDVHGLEHWSPDSFSGIPQNERRAAMLKMCGVRTNKGMDLVSRCADDQSNIELTPQGWRLAEELLKEVLEAAQQAAQSSQTHHSGSATRTTPTGAQLQAIAMG